ncbi:phage tail tape measure protein [Ruminococcus sp. BSD2780120874_150323_B10]|uniref:phage tail tape measure protein n=1 Tax=unclassified Ruminococcus TaxID=2608920 RepID=UPI001899ACA8|nr:phage tail tape measure protein [Ruminococcus sp. BSD2780120874_150323_B10]
MSNFEARITAKLDTSKFEQQMNKLQNKKFNLNVDTTNALQRLTALRRELDELINAANNIRVNLSNGNNTNNVFTNVVNQGTYAYRQLLDIQRRIGNISIKLNGLDTTKNTNQISVLSRQLNQLRADYQALQRIFNVHLNTDQMGRIQTVIEDTELKLQELNAKMQDTRNNLANSINVQMNNGKFKSEISDISVQISKLSGEYANINSLSAELNNNLRAMENSRTPEQLTTAYQNYENTLKRIKNELKEVANQDKIANNATTLQQQKNNLSLGMDVWLKKNSAAAKEFGTRIQELQAELKNCDATRLNGIKTEFQAITKEATIAGKSTLSFSDKLSAQIKRLSAYFSATMLFMESARAIRAMYDNVLDVDTAMTELYRVTDLTNSQYDKLYQDMISGAKAYASTLDTIINSTAEWVRLGFDADTAEQLAEISTMYQNVTDLDESTANENLVTAYKGFEKQLLELSNNDSAAAIEMITDIYDKLGNEFAESAADVGDGLSKSASVLSQGGASIQEAAGMFTGIQEVLQNSSTSGTALKILTLRIRGMKGELEELGEEVDDNVDSISKIQTQILNLTHGKVNIFDDEGNFRNIYDVMADISKIYDELSDANRASLLEIIAGKNRANAVQALINNWGNVEKATEAAYNSAGTAYAENEKYLRSLEGHIAQLETTWQYLSNDVLDSEFVKGLVDGLANVLDTTDDIVKTIGTLPTLLAGIAAALSLIKNKGIFTVDAANKIQLLGNNLAGTKTRISELSFAMQRYNNVSSKSASFQASYNQSLQNSKSSMAQYLRSLNGANASLSGYATYLLKAKVATIALRVASAALNTVVTMGISWAISALIFKIGELINAEETAYNQAKEVAEASREKVENISNEQNSLSELIEKYKELAKSDMTDSTNRAEIKDIQDEITKLVGAQADNLDLVNGKLDEELAKLKDIQSTQLQTNISTFEKAYVDAADEASKKTFHEGNIVSDWNDDNNVITFDYWGDAESRDKAAEIIDKVWKEKGYGSTFVDYEEYILGFGDRFTKLIFNADLTLQDKINAINDAIDALENTDGFDYNNNQTWKKLVEIKDALAGGEGVFTKQVEAAKTLLDELTTSEVANNNADIDSLEDYEKYRQEIIDNITNNKTISQAIKDKALSSDAIETEVDNYLSTLEGFSKYYNEWYDKFASDTAKGAEEVKNRFRKSIESDTNNFNFPDLNSKASGIEIFTNPELTFPTPKLSDEAKQEINDFNNWIDSLSNSDKDIVYKISTDFTSANVENQLKNLSEGDFDKWKQAVADYEIPEVDKFHFSDLVATEDFQNSVKDYEDKITKLADALKNLRNGELSESDKIELFENFPELASQADNLDGAIVSLLDNLDADIVEDFNNKLNYMETDDDVAALNNLKDSILNISSGARQISNVTSEITLLRDSLSNLKDTYNSVTDIMDNYNKNGYYSLENLQSLLELEPEYINTLIDENGQINLNSQAYKDYVAAKAKMLVVDQIKSLYENILAMTAEEAQAYANATAYQVESGSLQDLITTTTQYYLMLAKTKDAESGTTVYTESLQKSFGTVANYAAVYDSWLSSLNSSTNEFTNQTNKATSALENKKNALEDIKSGYENAIDSIKSLIDWTEKYIKQTKEDEIKSLEDKKKSVDDLIESQKELLQAQKDEYDWNKEISDKQNTVAKDALAASIANLDDSSAGKKSQKEATDALSESRSDMTDSLYEHSIDSRIDALDKLKDSSDEYYDSEIDKINEFLDNEVTLYKAACSMIDNDNGTLYGNLLNYCKTYTTTSEAEFNYMWTSAQSAMQDYNIANLDTFNLLNNLQVHIYEVDTAIDTIADSIQSYEDKISGVQTKLDSLSDSAQTAVSNISAALNKESELNKAKWYYDWQGKRYESSLSDKDSAIQDILRRIENKYGGRFPASAATIYGTIKHYAKGTRNSNGGLSVTQEDGFEAIFGKLQSGEYTMMPEGSQVFSNKMTDNLFNFSADPQRFITKLSSKFNYLNYFDSIQGNIDRKAKNIVNNSRQKNIGDITVNSAPIYIQGDATQSTVNALRAEADKIVNRATKNVMNIALRNKNII